MIFGTSQSLQVVFFHNDFPHIHVFLQNDHLILYTSIIPIFKKKLCPSKMFLFPTIFEKKNTDPLPCFIFPFFKPKKNKNNLRNKKKHHASNRLFRLFLRLHEMARSERCQASTPWRIGQRWSGFGTWHRSPMQGIIGCTPTNVPLWETSI